MIAGIGTDIVAIERFQRFVDQNNTALLRRVFTERERTACSARKNNAACYAARFAAKEAFLKALGTGLRDGLSWQDMEVSNDELGKPVMTLSGRALTIFQERRISGLFLSISHDGGCAVAFVVLEAP